MWILDLETDGLLDTVTRIHCASAYNTVTKEWKIFTPDSIVNLPKFLDDCEELSCHNGLSFDLPVLKKLMNYDYKGRYVDTLLLSRLLFPDIEPVKGVKSRHSVEAWGVRFNIAKPVYEDWSVYTEEMLHRNKEDVKIQACLYEYCYLQINDKGIKNLSTVIDLEQKVWLIIDQQSDNGWLFDRELANQLIDELSKTIEDIEIKLKSSLPYRLVKPYKETVCKAFKANGELTVHTAGWVKDQFEDVVGDFCRVQFELTDINSPQQLKDYLLANGWRPTEWNFKRDAHGKPLKDKYFDIIKTSPKLPTTTDDWDRTAQETDNAEIVLIAEYNKARHRRSQIKGLLDKVRGDGRIAADAITCATNTRRMVHRTVVNIPKASDKVYYGKQLRSLFIAPEGRVLVGADASALEARCEAHYLYPFDPSASMELLEGDIHARNAKLFGVDRSIAKNGKYAILYGCSAKKLAATLKRPVQMSEALYNDYWESNEGLKTLKAQLEEEWQKQGYLVAIDGAPLTIRYKHALINTLFQSCGSIIMKLALCILDKWLKDAIIESMFIGNFHDEFCIECWPKDAEFIGQKAVQAMEKAGQLLKLNVPITGEYKIGRNWSQTH